jgi:maltose alpha-D-glucosyltransferase / alpha-amylase
LKQPGSMADPTWFKDAIIYELHVRAFMDSNNDGIGDFPGLMQKLDYLQDLGVTCLWLLPFFPSPLRDDGYDIADYMNVNPSYGTLDDFKAFLRAAHDRNIQVMVELVVNHTSDQHPWFERARRAPRGSMERDYYVWSDTDQLYKDARIIFTDTEKSNWSWDPVAEQYYWHRFFSHQPDLNYDNPRVMEEVLNVMRYWLDMGVDGLRVDAIPYLVERDGTNCENLPETHEVMKKIRAAIDEGYEGRLILAEANQWPADVRPYFGNGDECHMAFHFPLMPRMYMALRQEDAMPITEIMAQTPDIPETCQWGIFLRNHDELTLEMVSDEERDYMYFAYSADPRMRINIGIRRRLAPLVDNNRRRIELLNSLLFSFPGTPILYYGDEIGMGDNIYLGDRNGVRTPMQWTGDRNAGFSRAVPAKLYSPVVMDPVWGYEAINVEAQQSDPSSLLSWMRNMIALRKLFRVFGRGTLTFLHPSNRKVLAYVREYGNERVLCVANLSRFPQPAQLDLSEYAGLTPVEMLGYVEFPKIERVPYAITLNQYGFLWLELQGELAPEEPELLRNGSMWVQHATDWLSVLTGPALEQLEREWLPAFLPKQRWFGGKSRQIATTAIVDWGTMGRLAITLVEITYAGGDRDMYFVPLAISTGPAGEPICKNNPSAVLAAIATADGPGCLHDGLFDVEAGPDLLALIGDAGEIRMQRGSLRGMPGARLADLRGKERLEPRRGSAEQSNTSLLFGSRLIMKTFRRLQAGPNPDIEIARHLCEHTGFRAIAPFGGAIEYVPDGDAATVGVSSAVAMLQGLVPNEGDGWEWTLEELQRYFEQVGGSAIPPEHQPAPNLSLTQLSEEPGSEWTREQVGTYLEAAALLGRRTGELHLALARPTSDVAFEPEPMRQSDLEQLRADLVDHANSAFDALRQSLPRLPGEVEEMSGLVLSRRRRVTEQMWRVADFASAGLRTRVHGDYHLGQVLRTLADWVILDFEGEPARTLAERRAKQSPMKDVAGMLRSFSYAAYSGMMRVVTRRPQDAERLERWARLWENAACGAFLRAYRLTLRAAGGTPLLPESSEAFESLLEIYVLDKALYELVYELNNRPAWVRIPLTGILALPLR